MAYRGSRKALINNVAPWVFNGANFDMDFQNVRYSGLSPSQLAVVRSTPGWALDTAGNLVAFGVNTPRIISGVGLWVEEARTNAVRNGSGVGASLGVIGSGGVAPTNWSMGINGSGLQWSIVGQGIESGINYTDIRLFGTATVISSAYVYPEQNITASYGQTWTTSVFVRMVAGSITNLSNFNLAMRNTQSTNSFIFPTNFTGINSSSIGQNRQSGSGTFTDSTITNIFSGFNIAFNAGPVDITIRVGLPQCENQASTPAVLASVTVASSGTGGVNGTAVYQTTGGTGTAASFNVTWTSGVLTVNSFTNIGNWSTMPASPCTISYVSGTATGWTGAQLNLVPASRATYLNGPSTPIPTSGSAYTRSADNISTKINPGTSFSMVAAGYFIGNTTSTPRLIGVDDGTSNTKTYFYYNGNKICTQEIANNVITFNGVSNYTVNPPSKIKAGFSSSPSLLQTSLNGIIDTANYQNPPILNYKNLRFGTYVNLSAFCNQPITRVTYWNNIAISNSQLTTFTQ
jgi:hypothetical protein